MDTCLNPILMSDPAMPAMALVTSVAFIPAVVQPLTVMICKQGGVQGEVTA